MGKNAEEAQPESQHSHSPSHHHGAPQHSSTSPAFPEEYYDDPYGLSRYVVQEKVLFEWKSPSKIEKNPSRQTILQLILMTFLVAAILLLLKEVLLSMVILGAGLVYVAMFTMKATYIPCQVTTIGLKVGDKYYFWANVSQFWFEEKQGVQYLYLRVVFPGIQKVRFIVYEQDLEVLKTSIGTYLLYRKPQLTFYEKAVQKVTERFPVDLDFLHM
jgi:hypothetical protein